VVKDPYSIVKNQHLFVLQNGPAMHSGSDLSAALHDHAESVRSGGHWNFSHGRLTSEEVRYYLERVEQGIVDGLRQGREPRPTRHFGGAGPPRKAFRDGVDGEKLRLCFLSSEYPPSRIGGIGRYTSELATGFARRGCFVHVVARAPDGCADTIDFEDGAWIHRLAIPDLPFGAYPRPAIWHNLNTQARFFEEACKINHYQKLDICDSPLWLNDGLLCHLNSSMRSVLTLMTSMTKLISLHREWANDPNMIQLARLEKAIFIDHRRVRAISSSILETARADYGACAGAEIVHLGSPAPTVDRKRRSADAPVVLFVGRLEKRKGFDVLLRSLKRVFDDGLPFRAIVAGMDTPNNELPGGRTRVCDWFQAQFANDDAFRDRVDFLGEVSDEQLSRLYAGADILVVPSRYESFGLVAVEGLSHGLPTIVSDGGALGEIVEDGISGLHFKNEDDASLAEKLRALLTDAKLRKEFGRAAKFRFESEFSIDVCLRNTEAYYRRQIANIPTSSSSDGNVFSSLFQALRACLMEAAGVDSPLATIHACVTLSTSARFFNEAEVRQTLVQLADVCFIDSCYLLLLGRTSGFGLFPIGFEADGIENRENFINSILASDEYGMKARKSSGVYHAFF
jgi:glycosyltransferase involved in cell wall biosynthesis